MPARLFTADRVEAATDRMSPMLIKELRQGMKARAFGLAFLLMQGLMVFNVLLGAASPANPRSMTYGFTQALFWICVAAPLLVIIPARALAGLQQEYRASTLELLFLTRLSAWRIVAGKWIALFSQAVLLSASILPYLLLRYFFGGINVADDVQVFSYLLIASGLLCAAGLCLSSYRNPAVRIFALLALLASPFLIGVFMSVASVSRHYGGAHGTPYSGAPHPVVIFSFVLLGAILIALLLLVWAADRIAPPARRHTASKRLLALALIGLAAALTSYSGDEGWLVPTYIILVVVCLDALAEPMQPIASLYERFARRGRLTALLNRFLAPGWAPAALFTMCSVGLLALLTTLMLMTRGSYDRSLALILALYGGLLGPLAIVQGVRPGSSRLPGLYFLTQLFLIVIGCIGLGVHAFHPFHLSFLCWIPTASFLFALLESHAALDGLPALAVMCAVVTAVILVRMRPAFARLREWEAESLRATPRPE